MATSETYPLDMLDTGSVLFNQVLEYYTTNYLTDFNAMWLVQSGVLVFAMHLGFMTLEAGSVSMKNKDNIIFKNVLTVSLSAITYYLWGFGVSYGEGGLSFDEGSWFIGSGLFAVENFDGVAGFGTDGGAFFFFQWAFAATAATIVSGAVAGRMKLEGYMLSAVYITSFVFPVVAHWVWAGEGWLTAFGSRPPVYSDVFPQSCGMFDFAGSAVVHMTGGVAAFWAAWFLGPREGYLELKGHNLALVTMGTFLLWIGWYGFNCGSTLAFSGLNTGKVAVTTTISPSAAVITGMVVQKYRTGKWDLVTSLNCALAGLVSITAGCILVDDWAAIPIGVIGALIYIFTAEFLKSSGIDDPVGAIAVHGAAGMWGALAVGIFGTPQAVALGYSCAFDFNQFVDDQFLNANTYSFTPLPAFQMAIQVTGVAAICLWVTVTTVPFFMILKKFNLLRVSAEVEAMGLDASEHGSAPIKPLATSEHIENDKEVEKEVEELKATEE